MSLSAKRKRSACPASLKTEESEAKDAGLFNSEGSPRVMASFKPSAAQRICSVVDTPVIVDADTGYGNAINVIRTVQDLIRAGAAGIFLEDQVWPRAPKEFF